MVGLTLAMLTTIAALYAYKSSVVNAVSTKANSMSQNISAALAVQLTRLLPQAGWGVGAGASPPGGAVNVDLVLLSGALLDGKRLAGSAISISSTASVGNAVVWRDALSGVSRCSALIVPAGGGLLMLGPVECVNAAAWSSLQWAAQTPLLPAEALPDASFSVLKTNCWPYSAIPGSQGVAQVTLTGSRSVASSACLTNILQ